MTKTKRSLREIARDLALRELRLVTGGDCGGSCGCSCCSRSRATDRQQAQTINEEC